MLYLLKNIRKRHGDHPAVSVDNLEIESGRLYILTGANGAGKSTLLELLAFLTSPSEGKIFFDGVEIGADPGALARVRRQVTLLHQSPYLFRGTVADNLAYGLGMRGLSHHEQTCRIDEALAAVGLPAFARRKARELSGGEVQRVALARALALKPRVLLLDEPFANVDAPTAALLEETVTALPCQGTTVIMTTHQTDHLRWGKNIIHLVHGSIAPVPSGAADRYSAEEDYSCRHMKTHAPSF